MSDPGQDPDTPSNPDPHRPQLPLHGATAARGHADRPASAEHSRADTDTSHHRRKLRHQAKILRRARLAVLPPHELGVRPDAGPRTPDTHEGARRTGGRLTGASEERAAPLRFSSPIRISGSPIPDQWRSLPCPVRLRLGPDTVHPLSQHHSSRYWTTRRTTLGRERRESGDFQGRNFVGRRDAGSAVDGGGNIGADAETRKAFAQRLRGEEPAVRTDVRRRRGAHGPRDMARPRVHRFELTAVPLPRPRVQQQPVPAPRGRLPASITGKVPSANSTSPGSACRSPLSTSKPASRRRQAAVEQVDLGEPRIPEHPPEPRGSQVAAVVIGHHHVAAADAQAERDAWNCSKVGSGWRPRLGSAGPADPTRGRHPLPPLEQPQTSARPGASGEATTSPMTTAATWLQRGSGGCSGMRGSPRSTCSTADWPPGVMRA